MMGLEKLLRGLYGSGPQIDMDKQIARSRVPSPMTFDFAALADGIKRNNVGTARIEVEAAAIIKGGRVEFQPTKQSFPLEGSVPDQPSPSRRRFSVIDWNEPAKTRLKPMP